MSHEQSASDDNCNDENESLRKLNIQSNVFHFLGQENPLKQAESRESYIKQYIDEQFDMSGAACHIEDNDQEMNNEETPVRVRPSSSIG